MAAGLILAFVVAREVSWSSPGVVEPLVYIVAALTTLSAALIAGFEPIVAMRAE